MLNLLTIVFKRLTTLNFQCALRRQPTSKYKSPKSSSIPTNVDILASIDIHQLKLAGIRGVILDLDNTIVSEDDRYLSPYSEAWIRQAKEMGIKFFFLSNGKRRYRVEYWSSYLDIPATSPAKKPFPNAFCKAMRYMKLTPKEVVIVGDSRHTDILGAWLVCCSSIQVASLPHPPRWWERVLGKYVQIPYPLNQKLWDFQSSNYYHSNY
ncbi:MAG: YqeG family HAD IIIA-type phosphatase [Stenomitos rutilans HA7619-LM2]|jgi:hypothetical protein|nr:YqeG family HAD IIIA-type phosphatase [Stenomitos rutilans HA7619-LM2]